LSLSLPPIDLQNKFAQIIEKIEEQKTLYTQELEKLQINFDALLQKSFQE
jgi:type I restriction enzyme, S subunit